MYFLRVFGGVAVEDPAGPVTGIAVQRRALALLALLAVHRQGCSRDKLIGWLWPESDGERARHRLAEVVHQVRKALGADAIVTLGEVVLLNDRVVASDVAALTDALAAGELEQVAQIYAGPFADGFAGAGGTEFDWWMEGQRKRFADDYASALESLAAGAEASGDLVVAAKWWKRLLAHDPYNSRYALGLIGALASTGDPANARLVSAEHERLLLKDLGMRPPLEFASRVDDLLREAAMRNVPTPARERPPFSDAVVADALPTSVEEALANAAVKGPPGGRHWDKLARYAIPGAILVAVAAVVVLAPRFIRAGQRARPSALEISRSTRLTADEGIEMQPAISPDGRLVAYAAGPALRMRIFIRPATGGRTIRLTEDSMAFEYKPRWSPDGSQILYRTPDGVFVTSALGGVSHRIASNPPIVGEVIYSVAWAPDGRRVLVSRGSDWGTAGPIASDGMSIVFLDGGAERRVPTSVSGLHSCDWSPEGEWVACVSGNPSWASAFALVGNIAPSALVLVRLTDGSVRDVTGKASLNQSPVWSANGRLLYFVSNRQGSLDIYAVPVSASGEVGEPRRVTTGLGAQSIDLATDGRRLVYNVYQARANIWSVPIPDGAAVDAATAEPLTTGNQVVEAMRVSRDHKWLVYDSDLHGSADIFRIPVAGGQPERLTRGEADEFAGDLSPDGQLIAYHAYEEGSRDIFVQRLVDGRREQVTNSRFEESFPLWSPDGAALAFHDQSPGRTPGTARGLFVTRRDRVGRWSEPRALREDAGSGSWSPDGRSLIAATVNTIEVIDADSGPPRVIYARRPGSADPQVGGAILAEDGRTVFFKSVDDSGRASLWSVPVTGGRPRLMVTFTDLSRPSTRGDFAVGAGRFFFALADRQSDIWVADVVDR